jgi:hypothetical protein
MLKQALMLAVLRNAVEDFQEYVHARDAIQKKLFQEAEEWILEKNTDWFFSFENICESLQLEPGYIRQGLAVLEGSKAPSHQQGSMKRTPRLARNATEPAVEQCCRHGSSSVYLRCAAPAAGSAPHETNADISDVVPVAFIVADASEGFEKPLVTVSKIDKGLVGDE